MRSQSSSWAMVRWSVSKPNRGRQAATRSASLGPRPREGSFAHDRVEVGPGHQHLAPGAAGGRVPLGRAVCRGVTHEVGPGVAPGEGLAREGLGRRGLADHGPVGRDVGHLDAQHEPHRVEPGHQRPGAAGLGGDPERLAVVDEVQVVLDVALGAQDEALAGLPGRQAGEHLGGDRVQPAEAVGPGHGHDAAVREVDHRQALGEQALLAHRVAVVGGHAGVGPLALDGAVAGQQGRAGHPGRHGGGLVGGSGHCCLAHSLHHPWIAMWVTSATKPVERRTFPTNSSAVSRLHWSTRPHPRHTRCTWSAWSARW